MAGCRCLFAGMGCTECGNRPLLATCPPVNFRWLLSVCEIDQPETQQLTTLLACVHTSCCYKMNARHAQTSRCKAFMATYARCCMQTSNVTHNNTGDQLHAPRSTADMPKIGGPKRTPASPVGCLLVLCRGPKEMEASAQRNGG